MRQEFVLLTLDQVPVVRSLVISSLSAPLWSSKLHVSPQCGTHSLQSGKVMLALLNFFHFISLN